MVADGYWTRLRGYLGRSEPSAGEGILLQPCRSVHMVGIRFALDIAFLDGDDRVVAAYSDVPPGWTTRSASDASSALELPAGTLVRTGTRPGDALEMIPARDSAAPPAASKLQGGTP